MALSGVHLIEHDRVKFHVDLHVTTVHIRRKINGQFVGGRENFKCSGIPIPLRFFRNPKKNFEKNFRFQKSKIGALYLIRTHHR